MCTCWEIVCRGMYLMQMTGHSTVFVILLFISIVLIKWTEKKNANMQYLTVVIFHRIKSYSMLEMTCMGRHHKCLGTKRESFKDSLLQHYYILCIYLENHWNVWKSSFTWCILPVCIDLYCSFTTLQSESLYCTSN